MDDDEIGAALLGLAARHLGKTTAEDEEISAICERAVEEIDRLRALVMSHEIAPKAPNS